MTIRFLTVDEVVEIQRSTLPNSGKPDLSKPEGALPRIEALRDYEGVRIFLSSLPCT
ncbi:hypothetical protein [Morganella morganii]|uniref:hypothetical protein n=1 Tax=Morganella morganii TaxID=582 RepID=UPI003BF99E11